MHFLNLFKKNIVMFISKQLIKTGNSALSFNFCPIVPITLTDQNDTVTLGTGQFVKLIVCYKLFCPIMVTLLDDLKLKTEGHRVF